MSLGEWVACYGANLLFWLWILRWGGAEWLEGSFISGFLFPASAPTWDVEGIKAYGWLVLIASTIWFIVCLLTPDARLS